MLWEMCEFNMHDSSVEGSSAVVSSLAVITSLPMVQNLPSEGDSNLAGSYGALNFQC
jgi:hypothetical protein